jgi:fatty acid desaturase
MSDDDRSDLRENETATTPVESIGDMLKRLGSSGATLTVLRLGRVVLYVLGIWTVIMYFWNVVGLIIGTGIVIISNENAWRRHGAALTFSVGIMTLAFNTYAWLWMIGVYLLLFVYLGPLCSCGLL